MADTLINHDTEGLSNLAKVTQLINERSQLLNLGSLDSVPDLNGYTIQTLGLGLEVGACSLHSSAAE